MTIRARLLIQPVVGYMDLFSPFLNQSIVVSFLLLIYDLLVSLTKFLATHFSLSPLLSTSAHSPFIVLYYTCSYCWMLQSEAHECILRICYQMKFIVLHILFLFLALLDPHENCNWSSCFFRIPFLFRIIWSSFTLESLVAQACSMSLNVLNLAQTRTHAK
jgi:hypothetical protein